MTADFQRLDFSLNTIMLTFFENTPSSYFYRFPHESYY